MVAATIILTRTRARLSFSTTATLINRHTQQRPLPLPLSLLRSSSLPFTTTSKKGKDKKDTPLPDVVEKVQEEQSVEMERRMAALKKFGLPKKLEEGGGGVSEGKPIAKTERKDGEPEPDYDEIWKDYLWYMDHQKTKGWKS